MVPAMDVYTNGIKATSGERKDAGGGVARVWGSGDERGDGTRGNSEYWMWELAMLW